MQSAALSLSLSTCSTAGRRAHITFHSFMQTLTRSVHFSSQALTCSLTYSPTHTPMFTSLLILLLAHSLTHSLTYSHTYLLGYLRLSIDPSPFTLSKQFPPPKQNGMERHNSRKGTRDRSRDHHPTNQKSVRACVRASVSSNELPIQPGRGRRDDEGRTTEGEESKAFLGLSVIARVSNSGYRLSLPASFPRPSSPHIRQNGRTVNSE